jgi:hypothetical protein
MHARMFHLFSGRRSRRMRLLLLSHERFRRRLDVLAVLIPKTVKDEFHIRRNETDAFL